LSAARAMLVPSVPAAVDYATSFAGQFERRNSLLTGYGRKILEKLVERVASLEIVEEILDRHAGPDKNRSSSEDIRVAVNNRRLCGHVIQLRVRVYAVRPPSRLTREKSGEGLMEQPRVERGDDDDSQARVSSHGFD
jgi:hypothetical protein